MATRKRRDRRLPRERPDNPVLTSEACYFFFFGFFVSFFIDLPLLISPPCEIGHAPLRADYKCIRFAGRRSGNLAYNSRNAEGIGSLAARIAGSNPPTSPIDSA
jgi:hypothetical protein